MISWGGRPIKMSKAGFLHFFYLAFFTFCLCSQPCVANMLQQDDDGMSGTIQFGGPQDMNDEMMNSPFVPQELQCDACVAVAYQLWRGLSDYNSKHPSLNYKLTESMLIDIMDDVCSDMKTWEGYGMKKINKKTRLSGPGMKNEDVPGVTASGGKWPGRLMDSCETMVGDHGEVTLYNVYKIGPSKEHLLKNFLCYGDKKRDRCSKLEEAKYKEALKKDIEEERKKIAKEDL